jgi:kinesin family member 4
MSYYCSSFINDKMVPLKFRSPTLRRSQQNLAESYKPRSSSSALHDNTLSSISFKNNHYNFHNQSYLKEATIRVALRIRPLINKKEANETHEFLHNVNEKDNQIIIGKNKLQFDHVFGENSTQKDIYDRSVKPLLTSLFKGYNATVLAYGQTGSGKTYSMGLNHASVSTVIDALVNKNKSPDIECIGLAPRVLSDLFSRIEATTSKNPTIKFCVKISFIEVYNEEIKDLLKDVIKSSKMNREPLSICEKNNIIQVVNLNEVQVNNPLHALNLLKKGCSSRVESSTAMNKESSRSHAIFTISLEQSKSGEYDLIRSKLNFADLAGSEQQKKAKIEGRHLKESIKINLGLLALGNVISELGKESVGRRHVPYRESKLTRLLQDSLGGNSVTVMLACLSPTLSSTRESKNTLRFANRVKKIKNKPIVNIDPKEELILVLKKKVKDLENQLVQHEQYIEEALEKKHSKSDYACQTKFVSEEEYSEYTTEESEFIQESDYTTGESEFAQESDYTTEESEFIQESDYTTEESEFAQESDQFTIHRRNRLHGRI